jgi:hypothetical protein
MKTQENLHQKKFKKYLSLEKGIVRPFFEELWYLRVPALVAAISCLFFALIDQTIEIYRVFALNLMLQRWHIMFAFEFVFLLSLAIWYSGRALSIKRKEELSIKNKKCKNTLAKFHTKQHRISFNRILKFLKAMINGVAITLNGAASAFYLKTEQIELLRKKDIAYLAVSTKVESLIWLPRLFGMVPLLVLDVGLFITFWTEALPPYAKINLIGGVIIDSILLIIFLTIVIERKSFLSTSRNGIDNLFSQSSQAFVFALSIFTFSVFSIPMVTDAKIKFIACLIVILVLFMTLRRPMPLRQNIILAWLVFFFLVIAVCSILLVASCHPTIIPSFFGSIAVVAIFLIVFVIFSSVIFYWGYYSKIAVLTALVSLAIGCSFLNLNDNHQLRQLSENVQLVPGLEDSFNRWVKYREDKISKFVDNKKQYPIYIVSAQGGGIFAAYHAALTLSRLQDLSPNFASHVFAISSVSGGSLGATVFSSLVNLEHPPCTDKSLPSIKDGSLKQDSLEAKAHCLLSQDFLSSLLSAGLFPDFTQRFLPSVPVLSQALDRARGLEYAFEQAWKGNANPLKASYYKHWTPEGKSPALVLNTTEVETGERLLLSPFTFNNSDENSDLKFPILTDIATVACQDKNRQIDFPLSTAAILSARFPFITPVGSFDKCQNKYGASIKKHQTQLADGGYFENSGFSTAYEIGQRLEKLVANKEKDSRFKVVYIAITDNSNSQISIKGLKETLSPILAFYNSKEARGRGVIEQAEHEIDSNQNLKLSGHKFRQFYLTHATPKISVNPCKLNIDLKSCKNQKENVNSKFNLPLGWYLSAFSQEYIRDRIGYPVALSLDEPDRANNNHRVMKSIIDELKSDF